MDKATSDLKKCMCKQISFRSISKVRRAIIDQSIKLVLTEDKDGETPQTELFDLSADPAETTNLKTKILNLAKELALKTQNFGKNLF